MIKRVDETVCSKTVLYIEEDPNTLQYISCVEKKDHTGACVYKKK